MPRTQIPVVELSRFGADVVLAPTASDQVNGMYFENDGRTVLLAITGTAGAQTVTVASVASPVNGRTGDKTPTVGNDETRILGPFRPSDWNQRTAGELGRVHVDPGADTGLSFAAIRLPS